jgi:hypothetical protein
MPRMSCLSIAAAAFLALSSCASETVEGAVGGAARGAIGGALSSGFAALIFGGDPIDAAARGAVVGATIGGVAGGVQGSQRAAQSQSQDDVLRQAIGSDAFNGLESLVNCRYGQATQSASAAQRSSNSNYALSGLWLQALILTDQRKETDARALYPALISKDADISNDGQAEAALRDLQTDLAQSRREAGRATVCSA